MMCGNNAMYQLASSILKLQTAWHTLQALLLGLITYKCTRFKIYQVLPSLSLSPLVFSSLKCVCLFERSQTMCSADENGIKDEHILMPHAVFIMLLV